MTAWKLRRTRWGWSLFYNGELYASADNPLSLLHDDVVTRGES